MLLNENNIKTVCFGRIKNDWLSAEDSFPCFLTEIPNEIKAKNEHYLQTVSDDFQKRIKSYSRSPFGRKRWKQKTIHRIEDILQKETILGIHCVMKPMTINAFQEEIKEFLRHVRQFAPELSMEGIGQAIRNYIVYAMFNELHQRKNRFNTACFGYSMLYPFTDNYIDSKEPSNQEKAEYNRMIRDKIEGKEVHPSSLLQQKTCDLLQMIETVYPREDGATASSLLLMMLDAQEDSMRQQHKGTKQIDSDTINELNCHNDLPDMNKNVLLSSEERLHISLYKGGISVLIDRFFVNKEITEDDLVFYLGFGFFLQLADDLQDIGEDSLQGHQTLFTVDLRCEQEEKLVNQLLHFVYRITAAYPAENHGFKQFILSNCYQLIYTSVAQSRKFFSQEYLDQIERYLPITYSFLESWKKNRFLGNEDFNQDKYMKILDEMIH